MVEEVADSPCAMCPFSLGISMLGDFISSFSTVRADVGGIEGQSVGGKGLPHLGSC